MKTIFSFLIMMSTFGLFAQNSKKDSTAVFSPDEIKKINSDGEFRLHNDWAFLTRFQEENAKLSPARAGDHRVVFMGNSITEGWINFRPDFFKNNPFIDRGISGQTTPQMLLRFRQDVINLHPEVVVILAGVNDIAANTGPSSLEMIEDNLMSMVELARHNGIKVVLSSVLPAYDFPWRPGMQPAEKIVRLNAWIKAYAMENNLVYLDYFSAMVDERNGLKKELTYDGVHPNEAGYRVMEPLAEQAIDAAMKEKE